MAFGSICFQVVETEPFKHFFCSCFKVIHDFIKCKSTLIRSGISKVCKENNAIGHIEENNENNIWPIKTRKY